MTMSDLNDELTVVREAVYAMTRSPLPAGGPFPKISSPEDLPATMESLVRRESELISELRRHGYDPGVR